MTARMAAPEKGRDIFKLSRDRLSAEEAAAAVGSASCGAVALFIGMTREDCPDGRKVMGLEYEAYEAMVHSELARLCRDIRARWPAVVHICVHHRLGWVKVGEASVVAAISSPHRREGHQAMALLLDGLKAGAPVWKKRSRSEDGTLTWIVSEAQLGFLRSPTSGFSRRLSPTTTRSSVTSPHSNPPRR
ncbi:molybdopterin synthase catalytic subunit isoform X3 [Phycodurus eques]|uniref:molybdopterin synthase catalytic subunit isoform X3 n=1 Tax=Phycodurus eques TaxID=693459 RepID=UPI002ACE5A37|nr:molybdopterin synthase catalytic subunit isoform X3 [Phycodurus eques]